MRFESFNFQPSTFNCMPGTALRKPLTIQLAYPESAVSFRHR